MNGRDIELFNPGVMAAQELAHFRDVYEGREIDASTRGPRLRAEQFGLDEKTAIELSREYDEIVGKLIRALRRYEGGERQEKINRVVYLMEKYFRRLSRATGLNFDVERAARTEVETYIYYLICMTKEFTQTVAKHWATIYSLPDEDVLNAARARERAITILRGLDNSPPTETSWRVMEESLLEYYQLLLLAIEQNGKQVDAA